MRRTDRLCFSVAIAAALMLLGGGNAVAKSENGASLKEVLDRIVALETDLTTANAALLAAEARIAVLENAQVQWGDIQSIPAGFLDGVDDVGSSPLDGFVSVDFGAINGLAGPHIIFTDANVHVRSGGGASDDGGGALTGLGNLIVGYNEVIGGETRTGSHNLVVGDEHSYTSYGGFVAGVENNILAPHASVSGGNDNTASGDFSSVSGGTLNTASGIRSSVSGGQRNEASGDSSSVSGGFVNKAFGTASSVSGGASNKASGESTSVSGGFVNIATGTASSVSGGKGNQATGFLSSISGGQRNEASGDSSSVSGGINRSALGLHDWVAGGLFQDN